MAYDFSQYKVELSKIEDWLHREFASISTGRANPALVDNVHAESYGSMQPLKQLASISIEEARTLRIVPWDKGIIKDIEKALQTSGLPLLVSTDGQGIRATVPQLTTENREKLTKVLKQKLEDARISVRTERQKIDKEIDAAAAAGDFGEDDKFRAKDELQKFTEEANNKLEAICDSKVTDIMTI
jgi:ribosome recycling factor